MLTIIDGAQRHSSFIDIANKLVTVPRPFGFGMHNTKEQ